MNRDVRLGHLHVRGQRSDSTGPASRTRAPTLGVQQEGPPLDEVRQRGRLGLAVDRRAQHAGRQRDVEPDAARARRAQ